MHQITEKIVTNSLFRDMTGMRDLSGFKKLGEISELVNFYKNA